MTKQQNKEEITMKEHYENLDMEIIAFDTEDVITTSGGGHQYPGEPDDDF